MRSDVITHILACLFNFLWVISPTDIWHFGASFGLKQDFHIPEQWVVSHYVIDQSASSISDIQKIIGSEDKSNPRDSMLHRVQFIPTHSHRQELVTICLSLDWQLFLELSVEG